MLATTIAQLVVRLQTSFTGTADHLARRCGFAERRSTLRGARSSRALVFGWLAAPDAALPQLTAAAALAGVSITQQGLDQRCTAAADLVECLLAAAVSVLVRAEQVAIPLLERFTAVELVDASTRSVPPRPAMRSLPTAQPPDQHMGASRHSYTPRPAWAGREPVPQQHCGGRHPYSATGAGPTNVVTRR